MKQEEIERQLARILASKLFRGSDRSETSGKRSRATPRLSGLLQFLVMRALNGEPITDAIVTKDFFHKEPQTFERGQAIARVQVGALRKRLAEYYVTVGISDPISIDIPVGTLVPAFSERRTTPPDKELERGLYHINQEAPENIARALVHFDESIRLRPENAEAHAGKAMALCTLTLHDITASPSELLPQAESEARNALQLDPNSWRAHAALGAIHAFRREWALADQEFRKALAINREGTRDHGSYGPYLLGRGDYEGGRDLAKRDEDEHPVDVTFLKRSALYLYAMRDFNEAERILNELFRLDEQLWHAHTVAALLCLASNRPQEALSHMRKIAARKYPDLWPGLHVLCLERNGCHEEARKRFSQLLRASESGYVEPLQLALGYIAFGDLLLAIEWLGTGADVGDIHMLWLHLWPFLDPLRELAEFKELIRRLGLPSPPGRRLR
jgi:Flp pilus assembly protein TadD